jgi:hypothetical protein
MLATNKNLDCCCDKKGERLSSLVKKETGWAAIYMIEKRAGWYRLNPDGD